MISVTNVGSHLTKQEKVSTFKQYSKFNRKIDFINFTATLKDICSKNCDKLDINFDAKILETLLDEFITKI